MTVDPTIRVLDALRPFPEIARVWLFGSRARGDFMDRADVDVAIECDPISISRWFDMVEAADASTLHKVDVIRLDEAPDTLKSAIREEGRLLYERQ